MVDESTQSQERPMKECPYCSSDLTKIYHMGQCPKIKSIEYYPDGKTRKIEFTEKQHDLPLWPIEKHHEYTVQWLIS
jgi:hypothetical protein